jgi:hypothetical protein
MIEGQELWKELIRILSVEGQPTKAALAQTCMGVLFIRSVSYTIFAILCSSEIACVTAEDHPSGPQTAL